MKYQNIFVALFLFMLPVYAFAAGFTINEIMYDLKEGSDSGREWVEVMNNSTSPLDLSTFKLFESGTAHSIKSVQGNASIPAGGYGVITDVPDKFLADNPGFSGNLFDSTFSLSNTGETISLKDSTNAMIDTLSYSSTEGGAGDGSTLGKIGEDFVSTNPTPGTVNEPFTDSNDQGSDANASADSSVTTVSTSTRDSSVTDDSTTVSSEIDYSSLPINSISTTSYPSDVVSISNDSGFKTGAGRDRLVSVHTPVIFSALTSGADTLSNESHDKNVYQWSFGDGVQMYGSIVEHTYLFPGQYNVVLVKRETSGSSGTSRAKVFVRQGGVLVRDNLLGPQGYITISNSNKEEVNIGGWKLNIDGAQMVFPDDTILSAQSALKFGYSWPAAFYADTHKTMRYFTEAKINTVTFSTTSIATLPIPQEIDLEYPDGTLAASTTDIHVESLIDTSIADAERDRQITLIQNALAVLRAKIVEAFSLTASSTKR